MGFFPQQAWLLHDVARIGRPALVRERLADLAGVCDGPLVPAMGRHVAALLSKDPSQLDAVARVFEDDCGAALLAAEVHAEAAQLYERQGAKGMALASAAKAAALAESCEGARTPALREMDRPLPLTRREREIASLAARGLSNRDIAEHLTISVRTVDNHLHVIYSKLGVSGRGELPPRLDIEPTR